MQNMFDHRAKHIDNILDVNNIIKMKGQIEALRKILIPSHMYKDYELLVL